MKKTTTSGLHERLLPANPTEDDQRKTKKSDEKVTLTAFSFTAPAAKVKKDVPIATVERNADAVAQEQKALFKTLENKFRLAENAFYKDPSPDRSSLKTHIDTAYKYGVSATTEQRLRSDTDISQQAKQFLQTYKDYKETQDTFVEEISKGKKLTDTQKKLNTQLQQFLTENKTKINQCNDAEKKINNIFPDLLKTYSAPTPRSTR